MMILFFLSISLLSLSLPLSSLYLRRLKPTAEDSLLLSVFGGRSVGGGVIFVRLWVVNKFLADRPFNLTIHPNSNIFFAWYLASQSTCVYLCIVRSLNSIY